MANLLYLVHRLPYPPNKGDKVRSYHLLKHLAARHRVFLGTFIDDPEDAVHIDTVSAMCASLHVGRIRPRIARAASLAALFRREPLTLPYYRDASLQRWVEQTCAAEGIDAVLVFSSAMAQYLPEQSRLPMLVDFVDVDSAKWQQYATAHRWPLSWLYHREAALLLAYERATAARASCSFFVTEKETALFRALAPDCASPLATLSNGVDSEFFAASPGRPSPFGATAAPAGTDPHAIVFTGAMDYWPNVDAVTWFVQAMLPALRLSVPAARLYIVGRNPAKAVTALESDAVVVTGTVADVRPYLQHAAVVVAPLRLARGVQNKVLEAMSMGRPVVVSAACAEAIDAEPGIELITALTPADFVREIEALLRDPDRAKAVGDAGRECVLHNYSWDAHLGSIDSVLSAVASVATTTHVLQPAASGDPAAIEQSA